MNDNKIYSVYMHIFPNGKRYIGMTKDIERRWIGTGSAYKLNGRNCRIKNAINEYDWKTDVQHIIIASNLSKEEAEQMEIDLIAKYQTTEEAYGYNMHEGGSGKKKVVQYDINMNIVKIWDSTSDASKELNINKSSINNCCAGRYKTAGGFIWRRYDEMPEDIKILKKSW